jgi:MoaA/NifB/PqqE/SkfB family radical SAM enzyme
MCTNSPDSLAKQYGHFDPVSLKKFIRRKKKEGVIDSVYLTGGEPTLRPDFFHSVGFIRDSLPFAQINIISNGRRFADRKFTVKFLSFGAVNFFIPIHGWDNESHDAVTGVNGSFNQTVGGLKNILERRGYGQQIEIRVVIHKINYKKLGKIFDFIVKEFPSVERVSAVFIEYEGHAIGNFGFARLSYKDFYPEFKQLKKYLNKFEEISFCHFPLCSMPEEFWPYAWRTFREDEVSFPDKCSRCKVKNFCLGVHKGYLELFGQNDFNPVKKRFIIKASRNYYNPIDSVN